MNPATIGELRHRVTLEAPTDTPDDAGGFARSYTPVAQLWARIEKLAARADFIAAREEQQTTHRVTTRWRGDVTQAMRFDHGGRRLYVRSVVDPDAMRRFLVCTCEEISG